MVPSPFNVNCIKSSFLTAATCPSRPAVSNGRVEYNNNASLVNGQYPLDTLARTWCDPGYSPSGLTLSYCRSYGWSQPVVTCDGDKNNILF